MKNKTIKILSGLAIACICWLSGRSQNDYRPSSCLVTNKTGESIKVSINLERYPNAENWRITIGETNLLFPGGFTVPSGVGLRKDDPEYARDVVTVHR